jgi:DNA-binding transcriptional ArsR family regulator
MSEEGSTPVELRRALIEALVHPLRNLVYSAVAEHPGATVAQVAERIGQPARRVRYQMERLCEAGLIAMDTETPRRNARERHYQALLAPTIFDMTGWTVEEEERLAIGVTRLLVADISRAIGHRTFAANDGHAQVRFTGAVDQRGWDELAEIVVLVMGDIEAVMRRSARRLREADKGGIEVILGFLLFETMPWASAEKDTTEPSSSRWFEGEPRGDLDGPS